MVVVLGGGRLRHSQDGTGNPPVQNWDLGRAENVDINVFSLKTNGRYLSTSNTPHSDVLHVLPHQGDPGPLQHVLVLTNLVSVYLTPQHPYY